MDIIVKNILFQNTDTGWTVFLAEDLSTNELIKCTMVQSDIVVGSCWRVQGKYTKNKYGTQFSISSSEKIIPDNFEKYISSGIIKGIGPRTAKLIIEEFKDKAIDIFKNNIDELLKIKGISENKLEIIKNSWKEQNDSFVEISKLKGLGLTNNECFRVYEEYGNNSYEVIIDNPFILLSLKFGFKRTDEIYMQNIGIRNSTERIFYGINYLLEKNGEILSQKDLVSKTMYFLRIKEEDVISNLKIYIDAEMLFEYNDHIYLPKMYFDERFIADFIKNKIKQEVFHLDNIEQRINSTLKLYNIDLSDDQLEFINVHLNAPISILTGSAGTGKSTTVKALVSVLKNLNKSFELVSPTGRAAQRLMEITKCQAQTIHRLFQIGDEHAVGCKINLDFIVIDEFSMVDIHLCAALFRGLSDNCQILIIGDPNQLESVGAGQVLLDLINSKKVPVCTLTKIFRQASSSLIIKNANKVIKQEKIELLSLKKDKEFILNTKPDLFLIDSNTFNEEELYFLHHKEGLSSSEIKSLKNKLKNNPELKKGYDSLSYILKIYPKFINKIYNLDDIQVLSPMKKGKLGTKNLNKLLQDRINPDVGQVNIKIKSTVFRVNDKVIQLKNNYEKNIYNGDIGYIEEIRNKVKVRFKFSTVYLDREDLEDIDLAYAITIHKSQGSEFQAVIIPFDKSHKIMHRNNLLYTAMTRGKNLVIFIGDKECIDYCINNKKIEEKPSQLKDLI